MVPGATFENSLAARGEMKVRLNDELSSKLVIPLIDKGFFVL